MNFLQELDNYCKENYSSIIELKQKYENRILAFNPCFFHQFPLWKYEEILETYTKYVSDTHIDMRLRHWVHEIQSKSSQAILIDYHKVLLLHLISNIEIRQEFVQLSDELKEVLLKYFEGIIKRIESSTNEFFILPQFNRYLFYCTLKSIPIGSHYVSEERIPYKFLISGGWKQFVKSIFLLMKVKGFKPFYRIHMAEHNNPYLKTEFNEKGWNEMFLRLRHLVETNKNIKGVSGTSWWFDPALKTISPEIGYFRAYFIENGGAILRLNTNESIIRDATIFNSARKKMFESGQYHPYQYLAVFSRKAFLKIQFLNTSK